MEKYLDEIDNLLKLNNITQEQSKKVIESYTILYEGDKDKLDTNFNEELSKYRDGDVMLASVEKMVVSIKNNVNFFFRLTIINIITLVLFLR